MSYSTIYTCSNDQDLQGRITAAAAQENETNPWQRMMDARWFIVTRSDIESAYASALAANNPSPGGDPSVITDGMILSALQAAPQIDHTP